MRKQRQILRDNWGETPWATIMFFQCCSLLSVLLCCWGTPKNWSWYEQDWWLEYLVIKDASFCRHLLESLSVILVCQDTTLCCTSLVCCSFCYSLYNFSVHQKVFPELNVVYFCICLPSVWACLFFEYIVLYNLFSTWKNCSCYC